jgi:hypothetical protein
MPDLWNDLFACFDLDPVPSGAPDMSASATT